MDSGKKLTATLGIAVFFAAGCSGSEAKKSTCDIFAMDTYMQLTAYGENGEAAVDAARNEIYRLEGLFSVTDENSEIYKLNSSGGKALTVSADTSELISFGRDMCDMTGGMLDITVYPVLCEWGFTTGEYKIPDEQQLSKLLVNVDWEKLVIDGQSVMLPENMMLDLGAAAKGFTSDKVIDIFRENGVDSGIVSLGGNVAALGKKPDGSLWKVAVKDPFSPDKNIGIIEVSDSSVITSGNYERYFTGDDGKRYCHIIDPETGRPADNGLASVTVIGESGAVCDALSTALFVMGKEKAVEFQRTHGDFEMILVEERGNIVITGGIYDDFENISDMTVEVLE